MKKTLLSVILAVGLLFTGGSGASAATVHYKDVNPKHNYYPAVANLLEQKAVSRTLENFRPNESVTRGQAASIIVKVLGLDIENVKDPGFSDVPKNHQFYPYIAALQNEGIIGGKGNGRYGINEPLTRGQMASILMEGFDIPLIGIHAVGYDGFRDTVNYYGGPNSEIADGDTNAIFNGQFAQAIETMNYYGYVSGYTTTYPSGLVANEFKRSNPIKRSQLALMIYNIQKGTNYEYLYFEDFDITNKTKFELRNPVTDEVKIEDPSIISLVDISNAEVGGFLEGIYLDNEVIENDYAILEPKKEGTTLVRFGNSDKVIEITVTKVDGKFKASFIDATPSVPQVSSTPLTPLTPATPIEETLVEEEETTETPIDENGREEVAVENEEVTEEEVVEEETVEEVTEDGR